MMNATQKTLCQEDVQAVMPEIRAVSFADILDAANAQELLAEYATECSIPEIGEANPQRETYRQMEASGMLRALGVFLEDTLIGFVTLVFYSVPHYGQKVATTESLFVASKHRGSGAGKELMLAAENLAMNQGAVAILYSAPTGSQFEKLLTLSAPYRQTNSTFCRELR